MAYLPNLTFQPYIQPDGGGEPIKELQDYGQQVNTRYDANIAKNDALDEHIAQLQNSIRPIDQPILDSLKSDTRDALTNIKQNGDWENAQMPLRAVARRLLNDPTIAKAQQNLATEQNLDKIKEEAQAQGHHLIQFHDYKNTPTVGPDGSYNQMPIDGVFDKKLDYESRMQSIFQGLEANSTAYKNSSPQRDETTGAIYQIGSGSSARYINKKMIDNVVANNLGNYLNTDEGQQRLKVLTTSNSDNPASLSHEDAINQIKNELTNVGLTRRFHDTSSDSSERLAPGKAGKQVSGDGTILTSDIAYQQNQPLSEAIDALDKKGASLKDMGSVGGYALDKVLPLITGKPEEKQYGKIPDNFKDTYDSLYKMYSSALGTKDQDKINPKIQVYLKNIQNGKITPMVHSFSDSKDINESNAFIHNGNLDGSPILDPDTHKVMSLQQVKDKYTNEKGQKISDDDVKDASYVGDYSADNPFADMTGKDEFVKPKKIIIGGHRFVVGQDPQGMRSPDHLLDYLDNKISKSSRTGLPVTFNGGVKVLPKDGGFILQDPQGNIRANKDGKPLSSEEVKQLLYATGNIQEK